MKITTISYQRVYPIGSYATHRIGLEASLDEGDTPAFELANLKKMVQDIHAETVSQLDLYRGITTQIIPPEQTQIDQTIAVVNLEFEAIRAELEGIEFKEDAEKLILDKYPNWKLAVDIKKLINLKPNKA